MLSLTDKDAPKNPQKKYPPPSPSGAKGLAFAPSKDISNYPPSPRDIETVTTPQPEELEHVVGTPPSPHRKDPST